MSRNNPIKDKVAISGIGTAAYTRNLEDSTPGSLALKACIEAIKDAGIDRNEIDGVCGSTVAARYVQRGLGLGEVTWFANPANVIGNQLVAAMNAIHSGACTTVLVYHTAFRHAGMSRSASQDPFRARTQMGMGQGIATMGTGHVPVEPFGMLAAPAYAAWAGRYLELFGAKREDLGAVAINASSNAQNNPNAVLRKPLSMSDYLEARMIREPLCMFDMDIPIDGAEAFIVTSTERAKDLPNAPVVIHAASLGLAGDSSEEQTVDFDQTGQSVAAKALWEKSDIELDAVDVFFPYDGFSIIALLWMESLGYCGRGDAGAFIADNWDHEEQRIKINDKVLVNPHGGSLREGGTQGAGHLREAVTQLRGEHADGRNDVHTALLGIGGMFWNSQTVMLRSL